MSTNFTDTQRIQIRVISGRYFLHDQHGRLIPSGQIPDIIEKLVDDLNPVLTEHSTQEQLLQALYSKRAMEILNSSAWVFNPTRRQTFGSGPCVYFSRFVNIPSVIKIGKTRHLTGRMTSLSYELTRKEYPLDVLAFIKTAEHDELETALHRMFAEHITGRREWFDAEPVINFLSQFGYPGNKS